MRGLFVILKKEFKSEKAEGMGMEELKRQALSLAEELRALRRDFHMHPELGLQEFRTARRIEEELDALGIGHRRVGETGVWATIRGMDAGDGAVLLRADIDALPITEMTDVPYRSQNEGVMHACGHDVDRAQLAELALVEACQLRLQLFLIQEVEGRVVDNFGCAGNAVFGKIQLCHV